MIAEEIVTLVVDVSVVISLVALWYQIHLQSKELKYSVYERLMSDFSTAAMSLVEHKELRKMYVGKGKPKNWDKYDDDTKTLYCYFDSLLSLFERVWISRNVKIEDEKSWESWKKWLEELVENEVFRDVIDDNRELYDQEFVKQLNPLVA